MFYTALIAAGYDGIKRDPGHSVLLDVSGELRAQRPASLLSFRMSSRLMHPAVAWEERLRSVAASRTSPPGRQSRYSRNGIRKSQQSCGTGPCRGGEERLADDIRAVLMERLRSNTSLIGCLQASTRRSRAREALSSFQQPGHPFQWQQCYRFSDIADSAAQPCMSGCMRGGIRRSSLVHMGISCGRGEEGAARQSRRRPELSGRRPLHFFRKCWRVAVSAYAGAAICFFGPILQSGFRAWERQSGPLQN